MDPTDLPPSEIATAVQRHIKRIADQAFWDAVEGTLSGNGPEGGPSLAPAQQVLISAIPPLQTLLTLDLQAWPPSEGSIFFWLVASVFRHAPG